MSSTTTDFSLVSAAVTSSKVAKDIGTAAIELRDRNQLSGEIAKMNGKLLKAQIALFADDFTVLVGIGGVLYRDGSNRRMENRKQEQ